MLRIASAKEADTVGRRWINARGSPADIGVIESRLEGLEARLRALERRDHR
jgi:hypothetical protein